MAVYRIRDEQYIPARLDEVWDFISSPKNLQEITPDRLGFSIQTPDLPEEMYPGMMIAYKVSPVLGIKLNWLTEITHVEKGSYFVDEQRVGPYALWHHEHHIEEDKSGVKMTDIVTYRLPLGPLGVLAHKLFVKKQLKEIFAYRTLALEKKFGK
jgi:ligand-binding SRPBCC domain-containing protein